MPDLSRVVSTFAAPLVKGNGVTIQGYLKSPPNVRATFNGLFTPRSLLQVSVNTILHAGETVTDQGGTRYLCGDWPDSNYRGFVICRQFVLFEVPLDLTWTRPITVAEPLTGLTRSTGDAPLGTIAGFKEAVGRSSDHTDVLETRYRLMVGAPIQLGDYLDGKRVLRIENTLGLVYGETN